MKQLQCSECMRFVGFCFLEGGITSARASIWRHGVSIFRTSTLVTARNVHTLVGTQMSNALGALVDVWGDREEVNHVKLIHKLVQT